MAEWYLGSVDHAAVTQWAALTVYSVGDIRRQLAAPTAGNERVWRCTTAGTSGAVEPTWTLTKASTTNDATAVWTEVTGNSTYGWTAAHARMRNCTGWMAAGDTLYVADDHAATEAATVTLAFPGTLASPNKIVCVSNSAAPPTSVAATAAETTTGTSNLTPTGAVFIDGVTFNAGTGASAVGLSLSGTASMRFEYRNCVFNNPTTSSTSFTAVGGTTAPNSSTVFKNCSVKFGHVSQTIRLRGTDLVWIGGGIVSGSSAVAALITPNTLSGNALISGVDFSNLGSTLNLCASGSGVDAQITFRNCKLPASWTGDLGVPTSYGSCYEMHNCDSGDTNYRLWTSTYAGNIKSETTIVRTGGASDGTTPLAWKMATTANAEYPLITLASPEISIWNDTTGSAKTITVEIVHDSQGTGTSSAFLDDEIWLDVQYLGTSGFPLGSFLCDCKGDVLATAADQASSSETWTTTGLTTPVKQKLSVTFTPQEKGYVQTKVMMAKASKTCYVCPKATVT